MNFKNKIILAPMVGVNDIAFRKLCTDYGADIVYSQMIDTISYIRGNYKLADFYDEKNVVAQFFGNSKQAMAECAKLIGDGVSAIDLNLGCPHSNVVERKCGSYLMKYPKRVLAIVNALVKASSVPVTVKIRAGYDKDKINAVRIAMLCEKEGATALSIHGRARTVNYGHPVDYEIIKKVKDALNIPVIGNGDIFSGKDALAMLEKTGCDSVMVARGAIGNPAIFSEIKAYIDGKYYIPVKKKKLFTEYMRYYEKYNVDFKYLKFHAQWLTKGIKGGARCRALINQAKTAEEISEIYKDING